MMTRREKIWEGSAFDKRDGEERVEEEQEKWGIADFKQEVKLKEAREQTIMGKENWQWQNTKPTVPLS